MQMSLKYHIIYVPGLGDKYDIARRTFFRCWRVFNATTEFVPMRWRSTESYTSKLVRINDAIDRAKGKQIILIGESAGGSMVMAIHSKKHNELHKTITISGKNRNGATVAPRLYRQNIAFREAMQAADTAAPNLSTTARRKFISLYPFYDNVVPIRDAAIPNTRMIRLFSAGHLMTIFLCLTLFSWYIVHTAKR